mgnify:CR=1 FL=1
MSYDDLEQALGLELEGEAERALDFYEYTLGGGFIGDAARAVAAGVRGECMTLRLPGIPFAEHIAETADWWGGKFVDTFGTAAAGARNLHDCITNSVKDAIGVDVGEVCPDGNKPKLAFDSGPPADGFMVAVPGWDDIFQFNNNSMFDERSKRERYLDYMEELRRSPTPPSIREIGEILTTLDDLQDEAATLAVTLMIAEKLAGRAIPGVGWVATAADALNIIQALARPATGTGLPGKRGKRLTKDKARTVGNGYRARLEKTRRVDEFSRLATDEQLRLKPQIEAPRAGFKFSIGDALQALQATDSLFGFGLSLGPIVGFVEDAVWLGIRGGELRLKGPSQDPFDFNTHVRESCTRSPKVGDVHPQAGVVLGMSALRTWSRAGRVMPYIDRLPEHALASVLVGMRMSEQVLGRWLRSGAWVEPVAAATGRLEIVRGGVEEFDLRNLPADEWVKRTSAANQVAIRRAIGNVSDRGRQAFYESLVSSIGWGLVGDLEPGARVLDQQLSGPVADAFNLLDAGKIPRFDLED